MNRWKKVFPVTLVITILLLNTIWIEHSSANGRSTMRLSPGVTLERVKTSSPRIANVNEIEINLANKYTTVDVGLPAQYGQLRKTTQLATQLSKPNYRTVGAINAAFYHMSSGYPIYLLARDNEIYNGGVISKSSDAYVSEPIAFGLTADGLAEIDHYSFKVTAQVGQEQISLANVNREREQGEIMLYTPQHHLPYTGTTSYGMEYVFEAEHPITSTHFGQTLKGKLVKIYPYGHTGKRTIPKNGFVISEANSKQLKFNKLQLGEEVTVQLSIDSKWQDARFMMTSGPMLVKDGKRNLTINTSSSRARQITARSAVAISKDKKKVKFITVDRTNGQGGMNLIQFADYIASLGYDRALNLDGGGSTAMAYRPYGTHTLSLANRTMYSSERAVSAILMAVSTAPTTTPKEVKIQLDHTSPMLVGAKNKMTVQYVIDEHFNPLTKNKVTFRATNDVIDVKGNEVIAKKEGLGKVDVLYDGQVVRQLSFRVYETIPKFSVQPTSLSIEKGKVAQVTVTARDVNGKDLVLPPNAISYKITPALGTVSPTGQIKINKSPQMMEGHLTVTIGSNVKQVPITVPGTIFSDVSDRYIYKDEVLTLADRKIINGYEDGTFRPSATLTRAHAAVILSRALQLPVGKAPNPNFKDVDPSYVYYDEIAAVVEAGMMDGKANRQFDPSGHVTRAQIAKMLTEGFHLEAKGNGPKFSDVKQDAWSAPYIAALTTNGVASGYEDGTFKPNEPITRIHLGLFLLTLLD